MPLTWIDLTIVGCYLLAMVTIGLVLKKRAAKNLNSYLMGDKTLPWYMLGLSNASGMFDISGTMWLVSLCFIYGMKSIWIPWLWPVFNQVFLMVFLSCWLRRSNVLTGAEWIRTRFGDNTGGKLSHMVVVVFAVISVLGFLAYGFIGIGKFIDIFVPFERLIPFLPIELSPAHGPYFYGIVFTAIATFYVMIGGMLSIVWADLLQFSIMAIAALSIGIIAMLAVPSETLVAMTPQGWGNPFFGWQLDLDWQHIIPEVNHKIFSDGYSLFTIFMMMMLFKGVLASAAGPVPDYDMQKILATKSPKEAALMSAFVSVALMPIRYFMVAGFSVLAIVHYQDLDLMVAGQLDFENILPSAILQFAPVGITGLLLAALLAAFMSTFASTVNAAPAYLVNDIYKRYINPQASNKRLIHASYAVSAGVVIISAIIGLYVQSINSILQWLVSGLWGGYIAPNILKWYWWRLNGYGYFYGMVAGIVGALSFGFIFNGRFDIPSDILPLYLFPLLLLVSTLACVMGSYLKPADDMQLLKAFYRQVRPWGFWRPVLELVQAEDPSFIPNRHFKRDMFNVILGMIAQTCLVALPIFIVIKDIESGLITMLVLVVSALALKKYWYDTLR